MTFGGIDPTVPGLVAWVGLEIQPIAGLDVNLFSLPSRPGAVLARRDRGAKEIKLTFAVLGGADSFFAAVDGLNAWAWSDEPQELALDAGRAYNAILTAADAAALETGARLSYTFTSLDGIGYGVERAFTITEDGVSAPNEGTAPAPWKIAYTPEAAAAELTWTGGQGALTLAGNIPAGAEIVIDSAKEYITIGGQSAMEMVTLGSRFFAIQPGGLTVQGPGGELSYREAWL